MAVSQWYLLKAMAEVIYKISQGVEKDTAITEIAKKYNLNENEIKKCF